MGCQSSCCAEGHRKHRRLLGASEGNATHETRSGVKGAQRRPTDLPRGARASLARVTPAPSVASYTVEEGVVFGTGGGLAAAGAGGDAVGATSAARSS